MFEIVHCTVGGGAHRPMGATLLMVRRMGWWPLLDQEVEAWVLKCEGCCKNRSTLLKEVAGATHTHTTRGRGRGLVICFH